VLVAGELRQLATPRELVARPADWFVASFTGANLLRGNARRTGNERTLVRLESGEEIYSADEAEGEVGVVVYPWEIAIGRDSEAGSDNVIRGEIRSIAHVGDRVRVQVGPLTAELVAASLDHLGLAPGTVVVASFKANGTRLVPPGH